MEKLIRCLSSSLIKVFVCVQIFIQPLYAQQPVMLTLNEAYRQAQKNYPVIKQKSLIQQASGLTIENLNKSFLPQITISAQATYQSAVTEVNLPNAPGILVQPQNKDQYKVVVVDVNQQIYDGGLTKAQKAVQEVNTIVEDQKLEVELYKLKEKINQLYLGILLLDAQRKQTDLLKKDIESGLSKVTAQVKNGTAFRSSQLALEAELLKADQRTIEIAAGRKGFVEMLGLFMNQPLPEDVQVEMPDEKITLQQNIQRPELKLFSFQDSLLKSQNLLINAKGRPRAGLFAQGGYGRPGLNLFKNQFESFYIGGVRFNWFLGNLYTSKRERQLLDINRKIVDAQKETFLLNTNTTLKQQYAEIEKLTQLEASDSAIINLRVKIKEAARAQLENGVITASDYVREVNAEDQARQARIIHQIQLVQAQINYQTTLGNQ